jgi:hypothetical protein
MPDKVTMINIVWMTLISSMLAATVALYDHKPNQAKVYGPYASVRPLVTSQY